MENRIADDRFCFHSLFFNGMPMTKVLPVLLMDRTTGKNIVWATRDYEQYGALYERNRQILPELCLNLVMSNILVPRVEKAEHSQSQRTKERAEVFTPSWIVNKMNNFCDEQWFMRKDVFNIENEAEHTWEPVIEPIKFVRGQDKNKRFAWQQYIDSRRCEITCGEAPYIVSRYDATSGEMLPLERRVGFLDRKLRVLNENAKTKKEWLEWAFRAFQASYGFEYQGDNLFLARVNLMQTFIDYYTEKWQKEPKQDLVEKVAEIISWNIWQMDGLKDTLPFGVPVDGFVSAEDASEEKPEVLARIKDWRANRTLTYHSMKGGR